MSNCSNCSTCGGGTCEPEITKTVKLNMVFDDGTDTGKREDMNQTILNALESMRTFLDDNRIRIQFNSVKLINEEQAKLLGFGTLPTILINGADIQPEYKENPCVCCAEKEITGWMYKGIEFEIPPKELVIDALIETIYGKPEAVLKTDCQCSGGCNS